AFVLAEDLAEGELDEARVRAAVDYAVAALELVDSRVAGWDIALADTVADNASSGLFVLSDNRFRLGEFEPRQVRMRMYDGGEPLRAGQSILPGALGPLAPVRPGSTIRADIEPLGSVSATFT